ncbi:MAG TPA: methyl viologen-reducing hydrogenase [Nitrospirota bacterium]|nr:methyl viologen-reducing hydrogenase [Nitrospirota bacterium]
MAMEQSKLKINIEWLSDCGGCHVAIVDLHEKILDVLGAAEILHCPVLTDIKSYPQADVGIISGAIRTEHDRHAAEEMRKACRQIIALGTCAVYGGLPGAALAHSREEILDAVFVKNRTTGTKTVPRAEVSPLEKMVTPLDEVINADLYLPGCPPHATFIFDALLALLQNRSPKAKDETVCGRCKRTMVKTAISRVRKNHEGSPKSDVCFLSQGYLCLGSVSLDRCLAPCPNNGVACTGCAGPTMQILTEPNRDIRTELAERMAKLTLIEEKDIVRTIEQSAKTYYAYAMATKMVGGKPTFLIRKWMAETENQR